MVETMCNDGFVWMNQPPAPRRPQPVREQPVKAPAAAPPEPMIRVIDTRWADEEPEPTLAEIGHQLRRWMRRRVRAIPGWVANRLVERLSASA